MSNEFDDLSWMHADEDIPDWMWAQQFISAKIPMKVKRTSLTSAVICLYGNHIHLSGGTYDECLYKTKCDESCTSENGWQEIVGIKELQKMIYIPNLIREWFAPDIMAVYIPEKKFSFVPDILALALGL